MGDIFIIIENFSWGTGMDICFVCDKGDEYPKSFTSKEDAFEYIKTLPQLKGDYTVFKRELNYIK